MFSHTKGALIYDYLVRFTAIFSILFTPFYNFYGDRSQPISWLSLSYSALYFAIVSVVLVMLIRRSQGILATAVFTATVALFLDFQYDWFRGVPLFAITLLIFGIFWALRKHVALILSVVFNTMLISSILIISLGLGSGTPDQVVSTPGGQSAPQDPEDRPVIVHLVLDEHAGIAGIPLDVPGGPELRQSLQKFYQSNGFRLFENAISEYVSSKNSIPDILNLSAGTEPEQWYYGKKPYVLRTSKYFELLNKSGYELIVHQSTYMDFCKEFPAIVSRCHTYRYDGTDWLRNSHLTDREMFYGLFGMYINRSNIFEAISKLYVRLTKTARLLYIRLPPLAEWDGSAASLSALAAFDDFIEDVSEGPPGAVYFAHILLPHSPYVFDSDCRLRPEIFGWMGNVPLHSKFNTEDSREQRYSRYLEQMKCTRSKLELLFSRMRAAGRFANATIVIHGDHGSRIYLTEPKSRNAESLDVRDYLDSFSTLFAAKAPGLAPGYDKTWAPVSQLLGQLAGAGGLPSDTELLPRVYLEGSDDEDWVELPWPEAE